MCSPDARRVRFLLYRWSSARRCLITAGAADQPLKAKQMLDSALASGQGLAKLARNDYGTAW